MPKAKIPNSRKNATKNFSRTLPESASTAVQSNANSQPTTIDNQKYPPVLIVILHYKILQNTRNCLQSVFNVDYRNYNVLVIDNGSGSSESKGLIKEFPKLLWMPLSDNLGFAGGCNAGISYGMQNNYQYIWLLNNDTTVQIDSLSTLVQTSQGEEKVGAANAAILDVVALTNIGNDNESERHQTEKLVPGRGVIDYNRGKTLLKESGSADFVDCDWLAASNLLLKVEAIKEVGAFDERYFLYFEDVELCHRLKLGGWRCLHVPKAKITHIGGASTENELEHWRSYYYTRNRLLFFQTYATFGQKFAAFLAIWMHLLRHCFSLSMKGDSGAKQLRSEVAGAQDFIAAKYGKWQETD